MTDTFDLVIKNGRLVDPQQKTIRQGDIGITNGKLTCLSSRGLVGTREIDVGRQYICPGFIDIHAHVDGYLYSGQCMARQGVTTSVGGNCGLGPLDLAELWQRLERDRFPINQAMMIGHSWALRQAVGINDTKTPAAARQIDEMVALLERGFAQGAIGLSFGLEYAPGSSSEEIFALAQVAADHQKLISIHIRSDSWEGINGIKEALKIAEVTGASIQISHLAYQVAMGMMEEALAVIVQGIDEGLDVTVDSGLYHAFATFAGSEVYSDGCLERWGCTYSDLYVATGRYAGQVCTEEIFTEMCKYHQDDTLLAFACRESEIYEALLPDYVMVSSDGAVGHPTPGTGHPQDVGTFPRFFQTMVRERSEISLIDAVRKCTILPAERLGLSNKGRLSLGSDADLVVFDLDTIADKAEYPGFGAPDAAPTGISAVIVNGEAIVENGVLNQEALPGRPLPADSDS